MRKLLDSVATTSDAAVLEVMRAYGFQIPTSCASTAFGKNGGKKRVGDFLQLTQLTKFAGEGVQLFGAARGQWLTQIDAADFRAEGGFPAGDVQWFSGV
jgi:hypothetical protein